MQRASRSRCCGWYFHCFPPWVIKRLRVRRGIWSFCDLSVVKCNRDALSERLRHGSSLFVMIKMNSWSWRFSCWQASLGRFVRCTTDWWGTQFCISVQNVVQKCTRTDQSCLWAKDDHSSFTIFSLLRWLVYTEKHIYLLHQKWGPSNLCSTDVVSKNMYWQVWNVNGRVQCKTVYVCPYAYPMLPISYILERILYIW